MSDKVYVGQKMATFRKGMEYEPFSRVTMWYDDEHYYTAGDDTGREMKLECPWATQAIVDRCLEQIKGYVYRPFEATGVQIDPAFELGDTVVIGGIQSVIGSATRHFDAAGLCDISAPGENEVDHEYPYHSPQDRELKRRVKLGQSYQGVKITRLDGLTIVETDGDKEGAKVVLNSKELSFYDAGGGRVLYFDPTSGTYKFLGEMNVNDKFVVDKLGNVTIKGSLLLSEQSTITWGTKGPVRYKFAPAMTGPWHDTMTANDKYRRDSLDGGTTWGDPYQFVGVDGKDGADGKNGSDATVPKYITETVIAKGVIEAPRINANIFGVYPSNPSDTNGAFILHAPVGGLTPEVFKIAYNGDGGSVPSVAISGGPDVFWDIPMTLFDKSTSVLFRGSVDFTDADVKGITAKFA